MARKKYLKPGKLPITYIGTEITNEIKVLSIKKLRDSRQCVNILLPNVDKPSLEYQTIKRLGAIGVNIQNKKHIKFCITEDKFKNFGLNRYTLAKAQ